MKAHFKNKMLGEGPDLGLLRRAPFPPQISQDAGSGSGSLSGRAGLSEGRGSE